MNINKTNIEEIFDRKNYSFFTNGNYNLNIVGVRTNDLTSNVFNDYICLFYKQNGIWCLDKFEATTDPGLYYLQKPCNVKGTAILVPGQYRGVYKLDYHRGQYLALCQRKGPVKVYRDNNRDKILDYENAEWGWVGANIHRAGKYLIPMFVDKFSAGCQVIRKYYDYQTFMSLCNKSAILYGNCFTYTLIEENDFDVI